MGVFAALSVAVMIAGAVLAPVLIAATSLHTSLVVLGLATLLVTVLCSRRLGGLDVLTRQRAEALASRVAVLEQLPITAGVPRLVLEQLASQSQLCPLPPRGRRHRPRCSRARVLRRRRRARASFIATRKRSPASDRASTSGSAACSTTRRGTQPSRPRTDSTILRLEGDALIEALQICRDIAECARSLERVTAGCVAGRTHRTGRRPDVGGSAMIRDATVLVIGAGYPGKRRAYERMAELGAQVVVVDEPGHWSEALVTDGVAGAWLPVPISGDADEDAAATLDAVERSGVRPDGVLTIWENNVSVAARVASALGLPGNPPEVVDAVRSKVRTREVSASLGLPTPRAQRVRSLDELFAAADHVGFPAVVKPEFGASAVGCVRVDDTRRSAEGVLTRLRCRESRAQRDLSERQRSPPGGVPGRRRVRRGPRHAGREVRVLERVAELADGRAFVPGDRTALPAGPQPASGGPARRSRRTDGPGLRVPKGRAARRGQVHHARPAHHRGERAPGRRSDPSGRRDGVGRRSRRGGTTELPGSAADARAEPSTALRRRRRDPPRTHDGSPGGPPLP